MFCVECPICKETTVLAGYLVESDLIGTEFAALSVAEVEHFNRISIEKTGVSMILDAWERFRLTYDEMTGTHICLNCKMRTHLIII